MTGGSSCYSIERLTDETKYPVGVTKAVELVVARVPGVRFIKVCGENPSDVYVRRYKLPPQIVNEDIEDGPEYSFIYNYRNRTAQIKVKHKHLGDMEDANIDKVILDIWNTQIVAAAANERAS